MYQELRERRFVIVSVAFDAGGLEAVRPWIRPAMPLDVPRRFRDIMAWSAEDYAAASPPTYPCLIDAEHVVADLYGMPNVPMAVWIDEAGRIVRPAEPAGATDGFRRIDRTTFRLPDDVVAAGRAARKRYVEAVRDWVIRGEASPYALGASEVAARTPHASESELLAAACFRLGRYLHAQGYSGDAQVRFAEARRLDPGNWRYLRQALDLQERGKASGPEFYAAVDALGGRSYYPPVEW